jgi:hypothetical protein
MDKVSYIGRGERSGSRAMGGLLWFGLDWMELEKN